MTKFAIALDKTINATERTSGLTCDVVVVSTESRALQVREALDELNRDMHIIIDTELSPNVLLVTSEQSLARMPGGCLN